MKVIRGNKSTGSAEIVSELLKPKKDKALTIKWDFTDDIIPVMNVPFSHLADLGGTKTCNIHSERHELTQESATDLLRNESFKFADIICLDAQSKEEWLPAYKKLEDELGIELVICIVRNGTETTLEDYVVQ